jgi:hypothetical protein
VGQPLASGSQAPPDRDPDSFTADLVRPIDSDLFGRALRRGFAAQYSASITEHSQLIPPDRGAGASFPALPESRSGVRCKGGVRLN